MAGFLNQKNRIMDFSLTEIGKEKAMTGNLNYKFASFSDKSISYDYEGDKISDYTKNQNLFEVSESVSDSLNPIYSFNNSENVDNFETSINIDDEFFVKVDSQKLLTTAYDKEDISLKITDDNNVLYLNTRENDIGKYITTVGNDIDVTFLDNIVYDSRFINKKKNLHLPPINSSNKEELFKSKKKNLKIVKSNILLDNDDNNVKTIVESLENNNSISRFNIKFLNDSFLNEYYFSIFEKQFSDDTFKNSKLIVSKIAQFLDEKTNKNVEVFVIGKIFYNKDDFDIDENAIDFLNHNLTGLYENYTFVNIFTMVVR